MALKKRVPDATRLSCLTKRNWVAFYICEKNTLSHKKLVIIYCLSTLAFLVILPVCCNISLGAVGSKSEDKGTHPLHRLMWCSLRVSDHNLGKGIFSLETPNFWTKSQLHRYRHWHRVVSLTPQHPLQDIFSMCAGSADVVSQRSKGVPAQNLSFCCHGHLNVSGVLMMGG